MKQRDEGARFLKRRFEEIIVAVLTLILGSAIIGGVATWGAVQRLEVHAANMAQDIQEEIRPTLHQTAQELSRLVGTVERITSAREKEVEFFLKRSERNEQRIQELEKRVR